MPVLQGTARPTRVQSPRALEGKGSLPAQEPAAPGLGVAVPVAAVWLENGGWQPVHTALSKDLQALLHQVLSWWF